MALDSFIAGRYNGLYATLDVGITSQGFELQQDSQQEEIAESDAFGLSVIDGIYRGGNAFLQFETLAFKQSAVTPFWPWGALGVLATSAAPLGRLASDVAAAMVLNVVTGTPADASTPSLDQFNATKSILAPNNPARLLFNSKLRTVPVRLRLLPVDAGGGTIRWFSTT